MTLYISNAFSLQMLQGDAKLLAKEIGPEQARAFAKWTGETVEWAIGHEDTSAVVAEILEIPDPGPRRVSISIGKGDVLLVAQLVGGRLPEGATTLPDGFTLRFFTVEVM